MRIKIINTLSPGAQVLGAPPRGSPKDFGTPIAKIDSPRGESIMPQSALRPDQLRTKAASLTLPQMVLRLFGIKFLAPERTYSSLQIAKFPFAYCGLKIIPDFQRRRIKSCLYNSPHPNLLPLEKEIILKSTALSLAGEGWGWAIPAQHPAGKCKYDPVVFVPLERAFNLISNINN